MQVLTSLLALIVVARVLGHLFTRWGQPALVGEMLAGVLLGPSVLGFIQPSEALSGIASLAVFLVVLSAGSVATGKLATLVGVVLALNGALLLAERRGINLSQWPERLVAAFGAEALFGVVVVFVLAFGSVSEALGLGCILNGRGVMALVVASIAFERGFIGPGLFSVLVLMGVATTLVTPLLFNAVVPKVDRERYAQTGRL